jgi:hypothetical protein
VALAVGGLVACVTSIAVAAGPSASALAPVHGAYAPRIDPANFVDRIDSRFCPLDPGTAFHYRGVAENGKTPQTDDVFVTHRTKTILSVKSTVVRDVVSTRGTPVEKTLDYYAQDRSGNVWYMGEDTWERHHGTFVKASDSWRAGVAGANPGIVMPGTPRRGDAYRQEYDPVTRSTRHGYAAAGAQSGCRTAHSVRRCPPSRRRSSSPA